MIQAWRQWRSRLAAMLICGGTIAMSTASVLAQSITLDGTLGPAKTLTGPNYVIPQSDGLTVGRNLFQSFGKFKLDPSESATFQNSNAIRNIITRVTGGDASVINGRIATTNQLPVNLFFINPNGIVFGDKAQLSIGNATRGSFVATTVDSLTFPQGEQFSARNPGNSNSLLRIVGDPSGFIASQQTPASIQMNGSRLRLNSGQSLVLLGGEVNLEGGQLNAPGGRIDLGVVGAGSQVSLSTNNNTLTLGFPNSMEGSGQFRANNRATLNVVSPNGGNAGVSVNAGAIEFKNRSNILSSASGKGSAGNIQLRATRLIKLLESSFTTATEGSGAGGNIEIESGDSISLVNSSVVSQTQGSGNAGSLLIRADGDVSISKGSISTSSGLPRDSSPKDGFGNAGNLSIQARTVTLANDTRLSATTVRDGRGGNIDLKATDGSLNIANSEVRTRTNDRGDAGNISMSATDSATVSGTLSSSPLGGVFTSTEGSGKAGDITINAPIVRVLDRAVLDAQTTGTGAGGKVQIVANQLEVKDGGQIRTTTQGSRNAGEITATVRDRLTLSGTNTGLFAAATSTGAAGNIELSTTQLSVLDGARISVNSSNPTGNSAVEGFSNDTQSISVTTQSTTLDRGKIIAETASGNGGNITLSVQDILLLRRNSLISTTAGTAQAGGNGGRITITSTPLIVAVPSEDSDIRANAFQGKGGNVTISTRGLFGIQYRPGVLNTDRSDITASSEFGIRGNVTITTPDVDPSQGLVTLPENLVDASNQIAQGCAPKGGQMSSFVATGRGGLPLSPNEPLRTRSTASEWVSIDPNMQDQPVASSAPSAPVPEPKIVEAQGWIKNAKGQVILVEQLPEQSPVATLSPTACLAP